MDVSRGCPIFRYPLLSQERVKLRTSNFVGTFIGSIGTKAHENFGNISRGRSQGVPKFFRALTHRAHCAVIFAIAQLSHEVSHWLYISKSASRGFPATAGLLLNWELTSYRYQWWIQEFGKGSWRSVRWPRLTWYGVYSQSDRLTVSSNVSRVAS